VRFETLRRWGMGLALVAFMSVVPYQYYRYSLEHTKRLRPIVEGQVYRSGCLTADGFRDAIRTHKIKTVINLWDESPDPTLHRNRFCSESITESKLCEEMGVDFRFVFVELLRDDRVGKDRLKAIDDFRAIMDDPKSYPVLIHCKAGLHRTGVLSALYRMEYNGWSRDEALRELRSHGFGYFIANSTNPYIQQYVLNYQPRPRNLAGRPVEAKVMSRQNQDE
jgi:tyrosine-protein phosphatase SIW14